MLLAFNIALTQMRTRMKQSVIAGLGVTFGIGMFILMISFMTGVNKLLEDTTLTSSPHIRLYNEISAARPSVLEENDSDEGKFNIVYHQKPKNSKLNLKDGFRVVQELRKDPRVLGVSPLLSTQVFYNYGPIQLNGIVQGVDILQEDKLFDVSSKMKLGKIENLLSSNNGILMGHGLAKKLNVTMGDKITISTPTGQVKLLKIVGIFQYGIGAIDDIRSYSNISTVQKIMVKDPGYITDINIKLKDLNGSKPIAIEYNKKFGYKSMDWETANSTILVSFKIRNILTYVVSITLLVVAGFGIYNIMNMTIYDKMKDIAILKATGFSGRDVMNIFIIQSLTIGFFGGLAGLTLGFILSAALGQVPFDTGGFLSIDHYPINYDPRFYLVGISFGIITTFLAGYFPSRKAAKIDPVAILRG